MPLKPNALVGRRVSKQFGVDGRFEGRVASYDATQGFELHYEDGDVEHVDAAEVLRLLLPALDAMTDAASPKAQLAG
ncbi:hypothetical protein Ctob_012745 [Chrysochromulina tobinii]|uniref:PTM/DIR17-like Tudor domain-containing protein n=1 Tax=Chrysochromulina tobinii TaxID=1460289 RepID=A0A0M0JZ63_9EUKA|nr:hypothetical protein Ctob_012745 [Chrysochromulina tobinii]|eukprot:KOO31854.1 hypothetical protein Ctob_012745 [Chrysochromulina sp. CCMP291]